MKLPLLMPKNESGFILMVTLVILLLLVVLGISATSTGIFETKIAGNEKLYKTTFYEADGATEIAGLLIEENVACPTGFATDKIGSITIEGSSAFWQNQQPATPFNLAAFLAAWDPPNNRDISYIPDTPNTQTNIRLFGQTVLAAGGAMQMAAGYQGKGKAAGSGGAHLLYDVFVQHQGALGSESRIMMQWRHSIGQEGQCRY